MTRKQWLRRLEIASIATTAAAFALTVALVTTQSAVESNPAAYALLDAAGWAVAGVIGIGVEVLAFAYLRRHVDQDTRLELVETILRRFSRGHEIMVDVGRVVLVGGGLLAFVGVADLLLNLALLTTVDFSIAKFHTAKYWFPIAAVLFAGVAAINRAAVWTIVLEVAELVEFPDERPDRLGFRVAVVFFVATVALAGVWPFVGSLTYSDSARAATTVFDDFEDGDIAGWDSGGDGDLNDYRATKDSAFEGSYGMRYNGSTNGNIWLTFSADSYDKTTFRQRFDSVSGYTVYWIMENGGGQTTVQTRIQDGDFYHYDGSSWTNYGGNFQADIEYLVKIDHDYANNDFDITVKNAANDSEVLNESNLSYETSTSQVQQFEMNHYSGNAFDFDYLATDDSVQLQPDLRGQVTDQSGEPAPNTTVEIVGVDTSKINPDAGETKKQRAEELLKEATNPLPDSWDPDRRLAGSDGEFTNASGTYVAVHRPDDWGLAKWSTDADLGRPMLNPPAEQEVILSVWDAESRNVVQDGIDSDLPGSTVKRTVIVERLDPFGDVIDTREVELTQRRSVLTSTKDHAFARTTLPAGVYRVRADGSTYSYTILVGDEQDLKESFATDLETEADALSKAAQDLQEKLDSGTFVRYTRTTNSSGYYNVSSVPENVDVVGVTAYKVDGDVLTSLSDPSPQDMRAWVKNNDYNGSVYVALEPRKYDTPTQSADVTVRKFSSPPFPLLDQFATKWAEFRDLVETETLTDLGSIYDVELGEWSKDRKETAAANLSNVATEDIVDEYEARTGNDWSTFQNELEDRKRTNEELRDDIRALEQAIAGLENQIGSGDAETSTDVGENGTNATATLRQAFEADFSEDDVVATWKDFNGSSVPIAPEYVSVNKRTGRGDEVLVDSYPIPNGSAGGYIDVRVVTEDGESGSGGARVKNPTFNGEIPDLRSIDVSSLRPGPAETVVAEPRFDSAGSTVEDVDVFGPDGNTVTANLSDGRATFTPAGSGEHFVRFTIGNGDGQNFSQSVRVLAGDTPYNFPPGVTVKDGRTGVFGIAGDQVDDARVKVDSSGSKLDVTALVDPDSGTNEVHYHLEGAPQSADQSITARVVEGDSIDTGTSLSRHVGAYLHGRQLADDAVVYRKGASTTDRSRAPIPVDGRETTGGTVVDANGTGTVIQTYTSSNGDVTVDINNDPGLGERVAYRARVFLATFDAPVVGAISTFGTAGPIEPVGTVVDGLTDWSPPDENMIDENMIPIVESIEPAAPGGLSGSTGVNP